MSEQEKLVQNAADEEMDPGIKVMTLKYRISLDDYVQFYKIMGASAVKQKLSSTFWMGWVELAFGLAFLIALLTSDIEGGFSHYLIVAVLIGMGIYSITYRWLVYPRSLQRTVAAQYQQLSYLNGEITVDLYENLCIEYPEGQTVRTPWKDMSEVRVGGGLYMVMFGEGRCLLIPASQLAEQKETFEALLDKLCAQYGRPRVSV